jgi:hypothetical protein
MRIIGAKQDSLSTPSFNHLADKRIFRLDRPMEMFQVIERVLLWPTQMHSRAMDELAELPSPLEAVEQVDRVADVALFENGF